MGFKYGCYFRVRKVRIRDCRVINISSNKIQLKEDFPQGNKILFKAVSLDLSFLGHVVQRFILGYRIRWILEVNSRDKSKIAQLQENWIVLARWD